MIDVLAPTIDFLVRLVVIGVGVFGILAVLALRERLARR